MYYLNLYMYFKAHSECNHYSNATKKPGNIKTKPNQTQHF